MFAGENGLGRNLFARLVARHYLNDVNGLCLRHVHPDCIEIRGSGNSLEISVDAIRTVSYEVNKAAIMTEMRRVVIIEDAYNLNASSSAALLKTLEQPPSGVVFLITVSSPEDVIETIRSRCVIFNIIPPSVEESISYLNNIRQEAEHEQIREYAELFRGRIGYVLRALDSQEFRQSISIARDFASSYQKKDAIMMCSSLDRVENRVQLGEVLQLTIFCLAQISSSNDMIKAIKKIEELRSIVTRNVSMKLFSTVLVKQMVE